ncbi:hypothetical protein [Labilibacter marinus]|uniref:hypothetical protein n=1 Tax=Labilibacter marinus TaxID=1477105 RepID=UPI0008310762|nr:hypothetical protein [Labilibacter marinus]
MDNPFSIDINRTSDSQSLIISGELIINHIDLIKEQLIEVIDLSKHININVTNPSGIDITFIQVIVAIEATYINNGLNFNMEGTLNEDMFALVANAGFNDLFKL